MIRKSEHISHSAKLALECFNRGAPERPDAYGSPQMLRQLKA